MSRRVRRILMLALLAVFCASGAAAAALQLQYRASRQFYETAVRQYVRSPEAPSGQAQRPPAGAAASRPSPAETGAERGEEPEKPPIAVDFPALLEANPDVVGWIYCEGTAINYPVLRGADNDAYLRRTFDGKYSRAGSIFMESANRPDFSDANTILYGHNLKNGLMFAELPLWADQEFYEAHPVVWLLTPEQDYRVELFSGYLTDAVSETYTVFTGSGEQMRQYLLEAVRRSDFSAGVTLQGGDRCVVLSTCAYAFVHSRYVLHGVLRPLPPLQ